MSRGRNTVERNIGGSVFEHIVDDLRRLDYENAYYIKVRCEDRTVDQDERFQINARSSAEAIRRILRRVKYNDGRFIVDSVIVEDFDGGRMEAVS